MTRVSLAILVVLLACNLLSVAAARGGDDAMQAGGASGGKDPKLRHQKRKGGGGGGGGKMAGQKGQKAQKKLRLSHEIDDQHGQYGTSLPAFAFDYSEYVAGAVIERSSLSDNLYLTMFLVGHRTIDHDWPFEMVSTAEEAVYSWGKAAQKWNATSTANNHRLTDADDRRSGIVCVMQGESRTHTVPAHWVTHTDSATDSTGNPITGTFEVLRCPIRGNNRAIYDTLSRGDSSLFVDLVRLKERAGHGSSGSTSGRRMLRKKKVKQIVDSSSSSDNSNSHSNAAPTDDRFNAVQQSQEQANADFITSHRNVIVSFGVPWKSRQTGYGVNFHQQPLAGAGHFDMWQPTAHPLGGAGTGSGSGSGSLRGIREGGDAGSASSASASANANANVDPKLFICAGAARPLDPKRADAGLPMTLEFVEHHVSLGVSHIFLGLALDWHSPLMRKYMLLLQPYIEEGKLSLSSLALKGYDDAMGFAGMRLNPEYAELFFSNQCLYMAKGVADYVVTLKPSQFLLTPAGLDLAQSLASMDPGSRSNGADSAEEPVCSIPLSTYWVPDPKGSFGSWGPADSTFSAEFFRDSEVRGPLEEGHLSPGDRLAPSLMSTNHVWLANTHSGLVCGGGHSYIPTYRAGRKKGGKKAKQQQLSTTTDTGSILSALRSRKGLSVYHFVDKVPAAYRSSAGQTGSAAIKAALAKAQSALRDKKLGHVDDISVQVKTNHLKIPDVVDSEAPQLGSQMKRPFWLPTDVDHLSDILSTVFKSV